MLCWYSMTTETSVATVVTPQVSPINTQQQESSFPLRFSSSPPSTNPIANILYGETNPNRCFLDRSEIEQPTIRKSSSDDSLQDVAPVASKWTDCSDDELLHRVPLPELRKRVSAGAFNDQDEHRAVAWRVLSNVLPASLNHWHDTLLQQRNEYYQHTQLHFQDVSDVIKKSHELVGRPHSICSFRGFRASLRVPAELRQRWRDDKLDVNSLDRYTTHRNALHHTDYQQLQRNVKLLDEIRKDVERTHPDLRFFLEPRGDLGKRRYGALERILLVFCQEMDYVQGMNEICGIIYYVLANDPNPHWAYFAEADTYYIVRNLITEMKDIFCRLDGPESGIQNRIQGMHTLLARHDPELRQHLDEIGVEANFYAVRWFTTFLSREFLLPDTIRLWDSLFASTHKDNFLRYFCATMLSAARDRLLKSDFSSALKLLQSYPASNMDDLLESSRALYIYETQITLACQRGGLKLRQALRTIESSRFLIMAFGFRNGNVPKSRSEQIEEARSNIRNAATGVFGRAKQLWDQQRNSITGDPKKLVVLSSPASSSEASQSVEEDDEDDSVYMEAILKAE